MRLSKALTSAAIALAFAFGAPALISAPAFTQDTVRPPDAAEAAVAKMNIYVKFLNDTIRASDSLQRYRLWVDLKKGPTGKEMNIYGLYSLYDVGTQPDDVRKAAAGEPKMPELDAAMVAYVDTYQRLAPVIDKASQYYDRGDYKVDKMVGGKAFHPDIVSLGNEYEARRKNAETAMRAEKMTTDQAALDAIEEAQGKKAAWQVRNIMIHAEGIINLLPDQEQPIVDLTALKTAMDSYTNAIHDFDDFASANPHAITGFADQPDGWLSELRDFQFELEKSKGDARKGAGKLIERIVSDYNTMVSSSETAVSPFPN